MLLKVNPTKQNIQTEQGALIVTGNCYVQLHTPLTDMRGFKVLIKQKGRKKKIKTKSEWSLSWETRNKSAWHQSPPKETFTHTRTHTMLGALTHLFTHTLTHTHTLMSSDYWAAAVTPLEANQREWRETTNAHQENFFFLGGGEKWSEGSSGQRVLNDLSIHTARCNTEHTHFQFVSTHSVAVSTLCHVQKIACFLFFLFKDNSHLWID